MFNFGHLITYAKPAKMFLLSFRQTHFPQIFMLYIESITVRLFVFPSFSDCGSMKPMVTSPVDRNICVVVFVTVSVLSSTFCSQHFPHNYCILSGCTYSLLICMHIQLTHYLIVTAIQCFICTVFHVHCDVLSLMMLLFHVSGMDCLFMYS